MSYKQSNAKPNKLSGTNGILIALAVLVLLMPPYSLAQDFSEENIPSEPIDGAVNIPADAYYRGQITSIVDERELGSGSEKQLFQNLKVKITSGDEQDKEVEIQDVGGLTVNGGKGFKAGDKVIINKTSNAGQAVYYVEDIYRLPNLLWLALIFLLVVVIFSRLRGLSSLLGLAITVLVIIKFVAPQIISGKSPLGTTLAAAFVIALTSLYLAHGFNRRTSIALVSTLITLGLAVLISLIFVSGARLFGNGSEEAIFLQLGQTQHINLQGLLLAGIILGALGVLDDITTAQSATVDELKKANPALSFKQLYSGASSVGREHISSLINTLFLAYAGVSLPLFMLFASSGGAPVWVTLNAEFIAEEIVRTLVGSITLILAVPITTVLAAYYFDKKVPAKINAGQQTLAK